MGAAGRAAALACGSPDPEADAYFIGKLVFSVLVELLWSDAPPPVDDLDRIEGFCLAAVQRG